MDDGYIKLYKKYRKFSIMLRLDAPDGYSGYLALHARSICRFKYFTLQIKMNTTSMIVWNHWLATAEQSSSAVALFKHIFWLHCIIFGSVVSLFESNAYYMNLHCKKKFPENRKIPHIYNQRDRSKLNISFFC